MATVRELMDHASKVIQENKAQANEVGAVYKFVLEGDDGGTFVIDLKDNPGVTEGDGVAQCTFTMAPKAFVEMIEGRVDSRQLFFMGKLKVEGDFGLAMKLKKLLKSMAPQIAPKN